MESALNFLLFCVSHPPLLTFFNLQVHTYQLSEINDNVEKILKCDCFTQQHTENNQYILLFKMA